MALGQIAYPFNIRSHARNYSLFPCNAHHCFADANLNARVRCLSKIHIKGISRKGRRTCFTRTKCFSSERARAEPLEPNGIVELPLFPLHLVLFPGANLSLQIFEYRYRMMMHTLLQTDLRFGVIYTDEVSGVVEVGCVAEVVKHERLVDGRFYLMCTGQERFRVIRYARTKPYLVAEVQWVEDKPSDRHEDLEKLADEVETHMKDVFRLLNRLIGKADKESFDDIRKGRFPTPFSFYVGDCFKASPPEQQALLELEDTSMRLKREKETLRNNLNYLSARTAVKDVFQTSD